MGYLRVITHLLTFDPNFQRDIQATRDVMLTPFLRCQPQADRARLQPGDFRYRPGSVKEVRAGREGQSPL